METLAGILSVEVNQSFIMMEQAKLKLRKIFTKLVNINNPVVMVGGNATVLTKGKIY